MDEFRLRVVSLNCGDGGVRSAIEMLPLSADVLLLQESPSKLELEQLAIKFFGNSRGVFWNADTSIVARWPIQEPIVRDHFVSGLIEFSEGFQLRVISIRLAPPVVRYDLWNPTCWREHARNRQHHKKQLVQLFESLGDEMRDAVIIGGDFNSAQHDRATWPLREFARDTFDTVGHGWGNTVLNTIPVLRFDQIWAGGRCRPVTTWAIHSEHSDHRIVVGDLKLSFKWTKRG